MKAIAHTTPAIWKNGRPAAGTRDIPEEVPVAIVHDGSTSAVMMATPANLEEFAIGFSLSEGLIDSTRDIRSLEILATLDGVEARVWLNADIGLRIAERRRALIGPTGCGLCGIESLAAANKPPRNLGDQDLTTSPASLLAAMSRLESGQVLGRQTRAVHAAGLLSADGALTVREDVGRHNALDKLIGASAMAGDHVCRDVLLLTSRVSVEMVQKAAVLGTPIICAISAPTALAVRTANAAGITLVGIAREDGFEVFTRPERIAGLG